MTKNNGFLITLLFQFSFFLAHAQAPAYKTVKCALPPSGIAGDWVTRQLYGIDNEEFLVGENTKKGYSITAYQSQTLAKKETYFPLTAVGKNPHFSGAAVYFAKDKCLVLGSTSTAAGDYRLYGMVTSWDGSIIAEEKEILMIPHGKLYAVPTVEAYVSPDLSKILVIHSTGLLNSGANTSMNIWLFDHQFNGIYEQSLTFPGDPNDYVFSSIEVMNTGTAFMIGNHKPASRIDNKEGNRQQYKLLAIDKGGALKELKTGGKVLSTAQGFVSEDGHSVGFTGFYRDDVENKEVAGMYMLKFNTETWKKDQGYFNPIPQPDIKKFLGESTSDGQRMRGYPNEPGLWDYELKAVVTKPDSSTHIVMEYVKGGALLDFILDEAGALAKTTMLPKNQYTAEYKYQYLGSVCLFSPTRDYFIYNDAASNFEEGKQTSTDFTHDYQTYKKSRLAYAYYSESKNVLMKKAMQPSNQPQIELRFDKLYSCLRLSDGSVIALAAPFRKDDLMLIRFYMTDKE